MTEPDLRGVPVLVTGHTGFKGAWLSLWLHALGARVSGLSLDPHTSPSLFEVARVAGVLEHDIRADLRDRQAVLDAVDTVQPRVVLHLGAQAILRVGYRSPVETMATNVMGTVHVLDAVVRARRPCAVVVVTSDKAYDAPADAALVESDRLGGHDPYSASKGAAEVVAASWRRSFAPADAVSTHGVGIATVRAGNVIGGGDWGEARLVPDLVRAQLTGEQVELRRPRAVRPWQHVLEPLSGYLAVVGRLLGQTGDPGSAACAFNFGPADQGAMTVAELARAFDAAWGSGPSHVCASTEVGEVETAVLRLSSRKAHDVLGWAPRLNTARAISWTARWYRDHAAAGGRAMQRRCLDELEAYSS